MLSFSGQATQNLPPEARQRVEGVTQGATGVGADALQTVGGGVKGVVDTAGNTVRLLLFILLPSMLPCYLALVDAEIIVEKAKHIISQY